MIFHGMKILTFSWVCAYYGNTGECRCLRRLLLFAYGIGRRSGWSNTFEMCNSAAQELFEYFSTEQSRKRCVQKCFESARV